MPATGQEAVKAEQAATSGPEDEPELYKADDFRMYCMKVLPCSKRFCHDWTVCPYSHPGEKAKRRDPRLFSYTGIACPDMKKDQACVRGDACPYAHNVFEYWLHPTRYRSQLCNDGDKCARKICFFAHSLDELRVPANKPFVPPEALQAATTTATLEAARKSAAAEGGHGSKAGENMLAALLRTQGGGEHTLLKQLQALTAGQQPIQDQQQLLEVLTALMESCGLGAAGQGMPFDASKAHSMPPPPRGDDRLDIGASGKSRSDPAARGRARGSGGGRSSRGRHSIDLGRDLRRGVAQMTIDENSPLPSLQSIVEALAASAAQQQAQQPGGGGAFATHSELAAFSAGMAAAQAAAAQQTSFEDARLHHHHHQHQQQQQYAIQQAQAAAELAEYAGSQNWQGLSPELLQALAAEAAPEVGPGGGTATWAPRWRQTRGAMPPAGAHGAGYPVTTQAAAHMRARAALAGEPWMGDSLAGSGHGLGPPPPFAAPAAHLAPPGALPHPFAGGAPGGFPAYHHPEPIPEEAPQLPPQHLFGAVSKEPSWTEEPACAHHSFLGPEAEGLDTSLVSPRFARGSPFDARRASTESSRRSSDSYMGSLVGQGDSYQPLCAPIDEYTAMRTSMESMRFSMDSMRSAGSPPGTPRGAGAQAAGFTDYRGSSLFAYSGPFTASAPPTPATFPPKSPPDGVPAQGVRRADSLRGSQGSLIDQQQ